MLRGRLLETLAVLLNEIPSQDFFLENSNISKLVLLLDVVGHSNTSHVQSIVTAITSVLGEGGNKAASKENDSTAAAPRKKVRAALDDTALRTLVRFLCLSPSSGVDQNESGALKSVKAILSAVVKDEIQEKAEELQKTFKKVVALEDML